jgi:hypothetical protein
MTEQLKKVVLTFIIIVLAFEIPNLGFYLMNQPDTYLFWLGVLIISTLFFLLGWAFHQYVLKVFIKILEEDDDREV